MNAPCHLPCALLALSGLAVLPACDGKKAEGRFDPSSTGGGGNHQGGTGGTSAESGAGPGGAHAAGGGGGAPCASPTTWPATSSAPPTLSATGLYTDTANKTLHPTARAFSPMFPLWSDGSEKLRYIYLPACTTIDTSTMDQWAFPVGTRVWKEFSRNNGDGTSTRLETRFIHRFGQAFSDWLFVSYVWNDDETAATLVPTSGALNVKGTGHDIPTQTQCHDCHNSAFERVLGFSAIQLNHTGAGETLSTLATAGLLSDPMATPFAIPGTTTAQQALGYLHANCGNCHNPQGTVFGHLWMQLSVDDATVEATNTFTTAVGVPTVGPGCDGCDRIAPGKPDQSALILRMNARGVTEQMPPLGSKVVDATGIAIVSEWIASISEP